MTEEFINWITKQVSTDTEKPILLSHLAHRKESLISFVASQICDWGMQYIVQKGQPIHFERVLFAAEELVNHWEVEFANEIAAIKN